MKNVVKKKIRTKASALYYILKFGRLEEHALIAEGKKHEAYQIEAARTTLLYALTDSLARVRVVLEGMISREDVAKFVHDDRTRGLLVELYEKFSGEDRGFDAALKSGEEAGGVHAGEHGGGDADPETDGGGLGACDPHPAAVTRIWKVYGHYGHRQKHSFCKSYKYDFSNNEVGIRIIAVMNSDYTGTNDYSLVRITRPTADECQRELDGQISDGIFEDCRVGAVVEIE